MPPIRLAAIGLLGCVLLLTACNGPIDLFPCKNHEDCGGHGTCVQDSNEDAHCDCLPCYHQPDPDNLVCEIDPSPCDSFNCSENGNGTCVVEVDGDNCMAVCECDDCYVAEGTECVLDQQLCDGVDCSGHGTCTLAVIDGACAPVCECDQCYLSVGTTCERNGYDCTDVYCSGHGTCQVVEDLDGCRPACVCELGFEDHLGRYCAPVQAGNHNTTPDGWSPIGDAPLIAETLDIWSNRPDNIWFAGALGTVTHFDGQTYRRLDTGVDEGVTFTSVWGLSDDDVWVVGNGGAVLHLRPHSVVNVSGNDHGVMLLRDVWGSGPDDVWVVGGDKITHWDGGTWTTFDLPELESPRVNAVWGYGPDDVWVVGDDGLVLHFDGSEWTQVDSGTQTDLFSAWGPGPDSLWIQGKYGEVLHWDGNSFSTHYAPSGSQYDQMASIWGTGDDDVWVIGDEVHTQAVLHHFDGSDWSTVTLPIGHHPNGFNQGYAIWGTGPDDIWATGSYLAHFDGQQWEDVLGNPAMDYVQGVWVNNPDDVWVAGETVFAHYDGLVWSELAAEYNEANTENSRLRLRDLWGASPDQVWLVGDKLVGCNPCPSTLLWDGNGLVTVTCSGASSLRAVWGTAGDDVWFAGADGIITHFDGQDCFDYEFGALLQFNDVWGSGSDDVWAVGISGQVMHFDGNDWLQVDLGYPEDDYYTVWGTGPDDVWVGGVIFPDTYARHSIAMHWDGGEWLRHQHLGGLEEIRGISGSGPNDVWFVGGDGRIHDFPLTEIYITPAAAVHFDGQGFTSADLGNRFWWLMDVAVHGDHVYAVGPFGQVLHKGP